MAKLRRDCEPPPHSRATRPYPCVAADELLLSVRDALINSVFDDWQRNAHAIAHQHRKPAMANKNQQISLLESHLTLTTRKQRHARREVNRLAEDLKHAKELSDEADRDAAAEANLAKAKLTKANEETETALKKADNNQKKADNNAACVEGTTKIFHDVVSSMNGQLHMIQNLQKMVYELNNKVVESDPEQLGDFTAADYRLKNAPDMFKLDLDGNASAKRLRPSNGAGTSSDNMPPDHVQCSDDEDN